MEAAAEPRDGSRGRSFHKSLLPTVWIEPFLEGEGGIRTLALDSRGHATCLKYLCSIT